jgi:hypothetical protein
VLAAHGLWADAYPGPAYLRPAIHYAPTCLQQGGWHDITAALTVNDTHHVWQGCPQADGWHHVEGLGALGRFWARPDGDSRDVCRHG